MKITKFGHSCLLVEEGAATVTAGQARIMIDPGMWSEGHTDIENLDAIFITHKHPDHADPESLKKILAKNQGVPIYSNDQVIEELRPHGIAVERFVAGDRQDIKGLMVEAHGKDHAVIYPNLPRTDNICFLIGGRLYHPGDSLHNPNKPVEILALPVCAPWLRLAEAIDFAKSLKPKIVFPIHDGMLKHLGPFHKLPQMNLEPEGIEWRVLAPGQAGEF